MRLFLEQLFTTGEITVPGGSAEFDPEPCSEEILHFDNAARMAMPGDAPELDMDVALWAATLLARSVRLILVRDHDEQYVAQVFSAGCPKPRSATRPSVDYSADLFLCHLPQLVGFVKRLAPGDPLAEKLREVAAAWPLSSVGMDDLVPDSVESFIAHPGLRQLYVDRIIATGDTDRINHPAVVEAIHSSLGAHAELSPEIAKCVTALQPLQLAD